MCGLLIYFQCLSSPLESLHLSFFIKAISVLTIPSLLLKLYVRFHLKLFRVFL
jgi:hypothetical protein